MCGAIGFAQGCLIGKLGLPPFIITLAGLLFARGLAFKVSDNGNTTYLIDRGRWMTNLGQERVLGIGAPVWIALALFGVGLVLLNRTRFGQAVFAIGGSEDAAILMGLPVARVKILLYTMTGLLSGLAGMLVAAQVVVRPLDDRQRARARSDRRSRHRRDPAQRRRRGPDRNADGCAVARCHPEPDQPSRHVALVPPTGGERRVPHRRGHRPDRRRPA